MAVLFDLDFTLIDSSPLVELRQSKQQHAAYQLIPQIRSYPGIDELLTALATRQIPIAIVTSSRKPFCERLIERLEWSIDVLVGYDNDSCKTVSRQALNLCIAVLSKIDVSKSHEPFYGNGISGSISGMTGRS